jgi:hypothetical protein
LARYLPLIESERHLPTIQPKREGGARCCGDRQSQRPRVAAAQPLTTGSDRGESYSAKLPAPYLSTKAHEQMRL